ncbi:MAG TPA: hypothetical protein VLB68_19745 [Pyrinomonadaceae bacterium]|nr:hypothetical protein [Pyrinomonadaceae bacterium]
MSGRKKTSGHCQCNEQLDQYRQLFLDEAGGNVAEAYKVTAAIARIMFGQDEFFYKDGSPAPKQEVHGLAYPSFRADKLGATVAFMTTAADKLYKATCATLVMVEDKREDAHYTVGILKQSKSIEADGTIKWVVPRREEVRLTASAK